MKHGNTCTTYQEISFFLIITDRNYFDTLPTEFYNIPDYNKLGAFVSYQDFTLSALSAKTVAIMAHNKGLELGAGMVLLLEGWGVLVQK